MCHIIDNYNLFLEIWVRVLRVVVADCYGGGLWVVVGTDSVVAGIDPISAMEQLLRNHLEPICINPELLVSVKAVKEEPVNYDIFSNFVHCNGYFVQKNLELNEVVEIVQLYSYRCSDLVSGILGVRVSLFVDQEELSTALVLAES